MKYLLPNKLLHHIPTCQQLTILSKTSLAHCITQVKPHFQQLAPRSPYSAGKKIDIFSPNSGQIESMENNHRLKQNRRDSLVMSDMITKQNTGVPGNKVIAGRELKIFNSGFDRDYVLYRLSDCTNETDFPKLFDNLLGISQFHEDDVKELREEALELFSQYKDPHSKISDKKILEGWTKVLSKVEDLKWDAARPKKKVKS